MYLSHDFNTIHSSFDPWSVIRSPLPRNTSYPELRMRMGLYSVYLLSMVGTCLLWCWCWCWCWILTMFCFPCRKEEKDDGRPRTVNIFFGFFLMINFVLGTGFLGIPYAFVHSGLIVGMFTLFLITLMSWMCSIFVLETMARAQVRL